MQPARRLMQGLAAVATPERCLFTPSDMRAFVPEISNAAWRALLSRAVTPGGLVRMCRGLYLYEPAERRDGLILFRAAARLRAGEFNYISLETVLSDAGVISQVPVNRIFVMSSGRGAVISCGRRGAIEFVHTSRTPAAVAPHLSYDSRCGMLRADVPLAIRDMRAARRGLDLIDWSVVNELA